MKSKAQVEVVVLLAEEAESTAERLRFACNEVRADAITGRSCLRAVEHMRFMCEQMAARCDALYRHAKTAVPSHPDS